MRIQPNMKWSGRGAIPAVGAIVKVTMNNLGWARVMGYYLTTDEAKTEVANGREGYIWLVVDFLNPPPYWVEQCKRDGEVGRYGLIYGAETKPHTQDEWPEWLKLAEAS